MSNITDQEISDMADKIIKVISNNTKDNIKESIVNGINYLLNKAATQNENVLSMPDLASEWFAEQRKKSGLTLRQVEEGTGISNPYLSQLENGKIKNPSFWVVQKLNNFYNTSVVKDNVGVWVKASERLPDKLKYYHCYLQDVAVVFWIDRKNEAIVNDKGVVMDKCLFEHIKWLDESQSQNNNVGVNDAIEFAEWLGKQNRVCFLCADGVRRWHELIGSNPLSTEQLYEIFQESQPKKESQ